MFTEHAVSKTSRGHDARVGDVDCDGELDIVGKPWGEGEVEPRDHIYLKNELVEKGGKRCSCGQKAKCGTQRGLAYIVRSRPP